jgi:hypothetical protein
MIAENKAKIIKDFCELNAKAGGTCSDWCIGATDDAERHLFGEVGIARDYSWYIYRCALSAREARAIVLGFHNIGFEANFSGLDGEDESAIYVYAYRKKSAAVRNEVEGTLQA